KAFYLGGMAGLAHTRFATWLWSCPPHAGPNSPAPSFLYLGPMMTGARAAISGRASIFAGSTSGQFLEELSERRCPYDKHVDSRRFSEKRCIKSHAFLL